MKKFYEVLRRYVSENQPNFGNGDSVFTMRSIQLYPYKTWIIITESITKPRSRSMVLSLFMVLKFFPLPDNSFIHQKSLVRIFCQRQIGMGVGVKIVDMSYIVFGCQASYLLMPTAVLSCEYSSIRINLRCNQMTNFQPAAYWLQ